MGSTFRTEGIGLREMGLTAGFDPGEQRLLAEAGKPDARGHPGEIAADQEVAGDEHALEADAFEFGVGDEPGVQEKPDFDAVRIDQEPEKGPGAVQHEDRSPAGDLLDHFALFLKGRRQVVKNDRSEEEHEKRQEKARSTEAFDEMGAPGKRKVSPAPMMTKKLK